MNMDEHELTHYPVLLLEFGSKTAGTTSFQYLSGFACPVQFRGMVSWFPACTSIRSQLGLGWQGTTGGRRTKNGEGDDRQYYLIGCGCILHPYDPTDVIWFCSASLRLVAA